MSWIALVFALAGAYLVTLENRKWHFYAFCLWLCSNFYWAVYNWGDWAICIQFWAFFALAIVGIRNTYKEVKK